MYISSSSSNAILSFCLFLVQQKVVVRHYYSVSVKDITVYYRFIFVQESTSHLFPSVWFFYLVTRLDI